MNLTAAPPRPLRSPGLAALPRRQRLRLDRRRGDVVPPARRLGRRRHELHRHRRRLLALGPRATPAASRKRSSASGLPASGKRNRVVLATKVGMAMGDTDRTRACRRRCIRSAVEASLRRLQTDVIDLYQSHDRRPGDAARGDARRLRRADQGRQGARDRRLELQRAAPARGAGGERRRTACRATRSLQPHYNLVERAAYEAELEPVCVAHGLGVINFYALARGFLTGKYRSAADLGKSARGGGAAKYLDDRGRAVLGRARRRRRHRRRHARPGGARLADRPAEHHRADRQRHLAGAARRAGRRRPAAARHAVDRAARSRPAGVEPA